MDTSALQKRLIALGYGVGPAGADGIFGRSTMKAVAQFQRAMDLDVKWPGTVGPLTIEALNAARLESKPGSALPPLVAGPILPPWYLEARRKIGLQEKLNNKTLREYLKSDGSTLGDPAQLPWCGDFMETVIALTLPSEPMIDNPYWALNWRKFGVAIDIIALGAIAPFSRPGGGHIGMIAGHDRDYFHVLGGNQSNAVTITKIAKDRLSGPLRWPSTYELPTVALPFTSIEASISTNEA